MRNYSKEFKLLAKKKYKTSSKFKSKFSGEKTIENVSLLPPNKLFGEFKISKEY